VVLNYTEFTRLAIRVKVALILRLEEVCEELIMRNFSRIGMDTQPSGDPPSCKRVSVFQRSFANLEVLRGRIVKGFKISVDHVMQYNPENNFLLRINARLLGQAVLVWTVIGCRGKNGPIEEQKRTDRG
jgi:hypothetical protein